jgi:hypothetical protein
MSATGVCRFEDCGRPTVVKREKLCQSHHKQFLRGEDLRPIQRGYVPGKECKFGPCISPARALGYCGTHYLQQYHGRTLRLAKPQVPSRSRDEQGRKWCASCETRKPEADFAASSGSPDGLQHRCRSCNAAIYQGRREEVRDSMREMRFGLSRAAFDAMFEAQGKACAICRSPRPGGKNFWSVDHDHSCCPSSDQTCGQCVRGILCSRCNHGLGNFKDDIDRLGAAIRYLESA